jgi:hypothetical protein
MMEPVNKRYKPWIVASLAVLVGSLVLLAADVVAAFVYFSETMPLWVIVVGAAAVLGVALGFAGFFALMSIAGWISFKQGRRVQILPPEKPNVE